LRVLGVGGGTDADIARAVRYAAGLTNPGLPTLVDRVEVINMSLGGPNSNTTLQNAVTSARNVGITVFAAAGNENTSTPSYPAAYANVVSVAAVDQNLQRAPYSNFNASVDLCAPGGDSAVDVDGDGYIDGVLSTLVNSSLSPNYVFYQGTSMACPHAAGLAALMLVVSPLMQPGEIENRLATTATDLGATGRDNIYGHGLINALAAVQSAGTGAPTNAQLVVSPAFLNFSPDTSQLVLTLRNAGTVPIDVLSYTDDVPWMTLVNGGAAPGIDIGSITVTIDRSDPALELDGEYDATITINTDAGNVLVPVTVIVSRPFLPDVELFVLAIDYSVDPPVTVAQTVVNPAFDGLDYVLDELSTADGELLPPGVYLVVCGSDENDDGFICGDGDVYCGLYPTFSDPALILVNGPVAGVDFLVSPLDSGEALTGLPGFPRRAGPSPARTQP
jgi:serine protease